MTTHRFVCNKCKVFVEDTTTKGTHKCPKCSIDMALDCRVAIHGNYLIPIHSDAMAISPTQVDEHKRLFPDIEIDSQCRPVFDNFTKHEAYLKKCNIVKTPQKIKRSGAKRIA